MEYCKTQGWESSLKKVPNSNTWLVVSDRVVALVEGSGGHSISRGKKEPAIPFATSVEVEARPSPIMVKKIGVTEQTYYT